MDSQTAPVVQPQTGATNPVEDAYIVDHNAPVALNRLQNRPQEINCPVCNHKSQTRVEKSGNEKKHRVLLNLCCWPLPNRTHWLEWTHWYCKDCGTEVAKQKWGKGIVVLAKGKA